MPSIVLHFADGRVENREAAIANGRFLARKDSIPDGVQRIDVMPEAFTAKAGDQGFFLIPSVEGSHHAATTLFKERQDIESAFNGNSMPVYGSRVNGKTTLAIVSSMSFEYSLIVGVKGGVYYLYPRFNLDGLRPYEDIEIRFYDLEGAEASYAGMARRYRKYQLERGACKPLRSRAAENPVLKEMAQGPETRIRLAWKPAPSTIEDQTEENEPPIHVELTFKQAEEIIDEYRRQGIEHAEFCLVGWNRGGHDGRFPDLFPVEPGCGNEEDLKRLIAKAKSYGYLICCHTNVLEAYSVAKRFKKGNLLLNKDLSPKRGGNWGGGKSYFLCPEKAYNEYFATDAQELGKLGFRGAHYLDVMSILGPDACHSPEHPLTRRAAAEWRSKTLALARESFGASASEGSWDFCAGDLDYVLYAAFRLNEPKERTPPLCDKFVPFWFIVYHGVQLYNCFTDTVNAFMKSDKTLPLRNYAWGGRPLVYFNSKFMSGGKGANPWGDEDLRYSSHESLRESVSAIKKDYELYKTLCDLQYEFIDDIEEIEGGGYKTSYSNGDVVVCDFSSLSVKRVKKLNDARRP